jgi:hypothetical protein
VSSLWDVVVDLSNVCRDEGFGPNAAASLERYDILLEACDELFEREVRALAVADRSLRHLLRPDEQRRLEHMERDREVESTAQADGHILRHASEGRALVISRDNFKDHRKKHPWIARDPGRFWDWEIVARDQVVLRERKMRRFTDFELSRAADREDVERELHLKGPQLREALTHRWSCEDVACPSHRFAADKRPLPSWDGQAFRCRACGSTARRGEPRPAAMELKFTDTNGTSVRQVLEQGAVIAFGRSEGDVDVSKLDRTDLQGVSSRHATFEYDGAHWYVTDHGSTNGTWVADWNPRSDRREPWRQLRPAERTPLDERTRVSLGDTIRVDRSGKISVRSE